MSTFINQTMSEFLMQRSHIFPPLVKEQHVENNCIVQSPIWQLQNEAQADTKNRRVLCGARKERKKLCSFCFVVLQITHFSFPRSLPPLSLGS